MQPCTGGAIPSQECKEEPPPPRRSRNEDCIQANCDLTREGKTCDQLCPRVTTSEQKSHPTGGEKVPKNWQESSPVEVPPEGVCSDLKGRLERRWDRQTPFSDAVSFLPRSLLKGIVVSRKEDLNPVHVKGNLSWSLNKGLSIAIGSGLIRLPG